MLSPLDNKSSILVSAKSDCDRSSGFEPSMPNTIRSNECPSCKVLATSIEWAVSTLYPLLRNKLAKVVLKEVLASNKSMEYTTGPAWRGIVQLDF